MSERSVGVARLPIELAQFLKFAGLASSGGEAKGLIADGRVRVNSEVETRRGRKLVDGDVVSFGEDVIRVEQLP